MLGSEPPFLSTLKTKWEDACLPNPKLIQKLSHATVGLRLDTFCNHQCFSFHFLLLLLVKCSLQDACSLQSWSFSNFESRCLVPSYSDGLAKFGLIHFEEFEHYISCVNNFITCIKIWVRNIFKSCNFMIAIFCREILCRPAKNKFVDGRDRRDMHWSYFIEYVLRV